MNPKPEQWNSENEIHVVIGYNNIPAWRKKQFLVDEM